MSAVTLWPARRAPRLPGLRSALPSAPPAPCRQAAAIHPTAAPAGSAGRYAQRRWLQERRLQPRSAQAQAAGEAGEAGRLRYGCLGARRSGAGERCILTPCRVAPWSARHALPSCHTHCRASLHPPASPSA